MYKSSTRCIGPMRQYLGGYPASKSNTCTYQKDHEVNGRLHKHICAFWLTLGKQLSHSEKNCLTKQSSKNEQPAANH